MVAQIIDIGGAGFLQPLQRACESVGLATRRDNGPWRTVMKLPVQAFQSIEAIGPALTDLEAEMVRLQDDWVLTIPAIGKNGFAISVAKVRKTIRGCFGGLDAEFDGARDAVKWVRRGSSGEYCLRTVMISGREREYHLEPFAGGDGSDTLATGHFVLFRRLRSISTIVRRNHVGGSGLNHDGRATSLPLIYQAGDIDSPGGNRQHAKVTAHAERHWFGAT